MGALNRFDRQDKNILSFNVTEYKMLNTFNITTYNDDIAMLFMDGSVPRNHRGAKPVSLNWNVDVEEDTVCQVLGWGVTEEVINNILSLFKN